jgi:ketose-bisphosphate aldolase
MPLAKTLEIYRRAQRGGYAVGGFCAENLEMIQSIVAAAEETRSPFILMLWQEDIQAAGPGCLENIARYAAERSSVPIGLMVDHATTVEFAVTCMLNGHNGIMIDGSQLSLAENIHLTRQVCEIAHLADVLVEGELGTVRRTFERSGPFAEETRLTNPDEVAQFIAQTGADSLAVSVGTESGINEREPRLDIDRLRRISSVSDAYLVIHGGSGTSDANIRRLVESGMTAMRFASALRVTFLDGLEEARKARGRNYPDTRCIYGPAKERVKAAVAGYMRSLGSVNRADRW